MAQVYSNPPMKVWKKWMEEDDYVAKTVNLGTKQGHCRCYWNSLKGNGFVVKKA